MNTDADSANGATDTFFVYVPQVEDFILPQSQDVEKAVQELMRC